MSGLWAVEDRGAGNCVVCGLAALVMEEGRRSL